MTIASVILDVDGTLVDSNDAHAQAWVAAFAAQGYTVNQHQVRDLIGMGGDKLLPTVVPGLNKNEGDGKAIAERRKQIFAEQFMPHLQPLPGARDLIQHMQRSGLKLIVASSAEGDELDDLLQAAHVADLLTETTSSSDAPQSKPDPDIVAAALDRIKLPPDQMLMLGDTPYDIQAAQRAGVQTIALRSGGWPDDQLHDALAIYDDPADLLRQYDRSPLAEGKDKEMGR